MKKIILALFVAFAVQTINAQPSRYRGDKPSQYNRNTYSNRDSRSERTYNTKSPIYFGLRAGFSLSSYTGSDDFYDYDTGYSSNTNSIAGFHVGYVVGIPIAKDLYIETGLYFGNKGYSSKGYGAYEGDDKEWYDYRYKETMRTYNVDFPLNLAYRAMISDNTFFDIKGGPYLTYAAFGTFTNKEWYFDGTSSKQSCTLSEYEDAFDNFNRFGMGLNFGCGFGINRFYIGLNYQIGLTNTISNNADPTTYSEENFMLSVGCNF